MINRFRYAVEAAGTFALTVAVGTGVSSGSPLVPVVVGSTLLAMIYTGSRIGANYHPAVTIALLARGRMTLRHTAGCVGAQLTGGLTGAALVALAIPRTHQTRPAGTAHMLVVTVAEILFTLALCRVVLKAAAAPAPPPDMARLRTAALVTGGALATGALSGGAFNPSIVICGWVVGLFSGPAVWIYVAAQFATGALAGVLLRHRRHSGAQRFEPVRTDKRCRIAGYRGAPLLDVAPRPCRGTRIYAVQLSHTQAWVAR